MMTSTSHAHTAPPTSHAPAKVRGRPHKPGLNVTNDNVRATIAVQARQVGISHGKLSEMCGRQRGWLSVYLHKGIPHSLDPVHRKILADALQLDERTLCPPGQAPIAGPLAWPGADMAPVADVPVFGEGDPIVLADAAEWAPRPSDQPRAGGMFAIQVQTAGARTRPGDLIYVAKRPPRIGDLAVCLRDGKVAAIGELAHLDTNVVRLNTGLAIRELPAREHQLCKVTSLVTA